MRFVNNCLDYIQDAISGQHFTGTQFSGKKCLGIIGMTGFGLGIVMGIHIGFILAALLVLNLSVMEVENLIIWIHWSLYAIALCLFHILEFYAVAAYNPKDLSLDSFLINHSKSYTLAAVSSWIEYWIETVYFKSLKHNNYFIFSGLVFIVLGQTVRTAAMVTCGEHFSHLIMQRRAPCHQLVTTGIYSVFRHPSYFGWFYWTIGTQILLCNPVCTIGYTIAAWKFFSIRIPYEEQLLVDFYEKQYMDYMKRTVVGIPFISSKSLSFLYYRLNLKE